MPKLGTYSRRSLSSKEWHKELLFSWLFQTCFKLQASLDRRFLNFGMTFQEAAVLMRCVEAGEIVPGRLALILARDKSKITRFVDRLEAAELVKRLVNPRDRRYSVIKATLKGKRLAERIASTVEKIRKELFVSVLDCDIERLSKVLPQLHLNALRIGTKRSVAEGQQKRRIGVGKNALQEETCVPATPSSGVKSDHLIPKVQEEPDGGLVQADCKKTESQTEEGFTSPAEVLLSR
jgi:MarR family transcriptional regulator, transcriptional regulator for hemolysin